ncbi:MULTISPECIES: VOC family protein [Bacillaceae]|uniref:VOC family protein n=1 Tax=Bacillaceae TaxID=186817 RepID=UPI001E341498|nr:MULTISPECIES: VOC family protein [Bacillaceae]MCE4050811.1 VOC family protein [Bacillus sp. Au-Bac7]MCM3034216.1 VOC family protein [Niallia sp. MER 6]UPO89901.1 VOC family protein [Niallia sp. Man26]
MKLGAFSVSLNVKDIAVSKSFYEKLGFQSFGGDITQNWLVLKNGNCIIGLFQGMFDKNILTFNPGWNENAENLEAFTDIRDIQKQLKAEGINFQNEADEATNGPAHFFIEDPDGNQILVDQHR